VKLIWDTLKFVWDTGDGFFQAHPWAKEVVTIVLIVIAINLARSSVRGE
jgi:hypothetical protein